MSEEGELGIGFRFYIRVVFVLPVVMTTFTPFVNHISAFTPLGPAMVPNRGRFRLRLDDPLLPGPLYFDLDRSPVTIGLHEGEVFFLDLKKGGDLGESEMEKQKRKIERSRDYYFRVIPIP